MSERHKNHHIHAHAHPRVCPQHPQAPRAVSHPPASSSPASRPPSEDHHPLSPITPSLVFLALHRAIWLRRIVFNPSHIKGTLLRMLSGLAVTVPRHACGSPAATAVFYPPRAYWQHWLVRPTVQAASGSSWHRWGGKRPCTRTWGRHCQATGYTCHLIVSGSAKFSKGRL